MTRKTVPVLLAALLAAFAMMTTVGGCGGPKIKECMSNYDCDSGEVCIQNECVKANAPSNGPYHVDGDKDSSSYVPVDVPEDYQPPNCDDGNVCTYDLFDGSSCKHLPMGNTIACKTSDGSPGHCPPAELCTEQSCECIADSLDCDDGLECTEDILNTANSTCTYKIKDGTCLIDRQCHNDGDVHPTNPCLVCNAESTKNAWSYLPEGTACDDGNPNTTNDQCNGRGVCIGEPFVPECTNDDECDDGIDCTYDTCTSGHCDNPIMPHFCLIDNVCVAEGDANNGNICIVCKPDNSTSDWTIDEGASCDDGDASTVEDKCQPDGSCAGITAQCTSDDQCDDGIDCTTDTCDMQTYTCQNVVSDGFCLIDGTCHTDGEANPNNICLICDPTTNDSDWSPAPSDTSCDDGNANTINDKCDGSGNCAGEEISCTEDTDCTTELTCMTGTCVEGKCEFAIGQFNCLIDDTCYGEGDVNPNNPCLVCTPSENQTGWSYNNGVSCDDNDTCTQNDVCINGECMGEWVDGCCHEDSQCDDGIECTEDSCLVPFTTCVNNVMSGYCLINGECITEGSENPENVCLSCNTAETQTAWSNANEGLSCEDGTDKICIEGQCLLPWNCTDDSYEDNDNYMEATEIDINTTYENLHICQNDNGGDWYKVTLPACTEDIEVKAMFTHAEGDINIIVYNEDMTQSFQGISTDDNETVTLTDVPAQAIYYIYVSLYVANGGQDVDGNDYTLTVTVPDTCLPECTTNDQCDDNNECTMDVCDTTTGTCTHPIISGTTCDDNNLCTINDTCNENGVCEGEEVTCDDGDPCTTGTCNPDTGQCEYGPKCDDENPCTTDTCDPTTGICDNQPVSDGTTCDDGNEYTIEDTCNAGVCEGHLLTIYDIQNPASQYHPNEDDEVKLQTAIVMSEPISISSSLNLFYIADTDYGKWHGITVVYNKNNLDLSELAVGDIVSIHGSYVEFNDLSEIMATAVAITGHQDAHQPILISDPCSIATGGADAEAYESVLVEVHDVTVTEPDLGYNEFEVGGCLRVDDKLYPEFPLPAENTVYSILRGFLGYSYSNYKLWPRDANDMVE